MIFNLQLHAFDFNLYFVLHGTGVLQIGEYLLVYKTFTIIGRRSRNFGDIFGWRDSFGFCFKKRFSINTHVWKDFDSTMGMGCHKNGMKDAREGEAHYWKRKESCTTTSHIPIIILGFWLDFPISSNIPHSSNIYKKKNSPHARQRRADSGAMKKEKKTKGIFS